MTGLSDKHSLVDAFIALIRASRNDCQTLNCNAARASFVVKTPSYPAVVLRRHWCRPFLRPVASWKELSPLLQRTATATKG